MSTTGPVPKHWLGFSQIGSEYYELDLNFDETKMRIKEDNYPKKKINPFTRKLQSLRNNYFIKLI